MYWCTSSMVLVMQNSAPVLFAILLKLIVCFDNFFTLCIVTSVDRILASTTYVIDVEPFYNRRSGEGGRVVDKVLAVEETNGHRL